MAPNVKSTPLGSGLISTDPEPDGSEGDGGQEVACELVEAGGDAPEMLELAEEALDEVALAVDAPVDGAMNEPAAG